MLTTQLAEAPKMLPQAVRATDAPMPAKAALMLVRAMCCMLRPTTPEMIGLHRPLTPSRPRIGAYVFMLQRWLGGVKRENPTPIH